MMFASVGTFDHNNKDHESPTQLTCHMAALYFEKREV